MAVNQSRQGESSDTGSSLPVIPTSFIGRERDLDGVAQLLAQFRLVTLTGSPGSGKTRLALRVAELVQNNYPDGVFWAGLAPVTQPENVEAAVARAAGAVSQSRQSTLESLLDALRGKHCLLILDNCENVLESCRRLLGTLLRTPHLAVLATSREPLGLAAEQRYAVEPLPPPSPSLHLPELKQNDAVRLFVERARAILPRFQLTEDNARTIATICHRLDGLPLAIELASARVNVLSVDQIAQRLDERFDILSRSPHVAGHHETLHAALDWSYDLLRAGEQALLRRLSVFSGGFTLSAAEAVCAGDGIEPGHILDTLSSLVDKSLLGAQTLGAGEARYSLLETVRQYLLPLLEANGVFTSTKRRHFEHYLELAEQAAARLHGEEQQLWLARLDAEQDNLRAALAWSSESRQARPGLRLATALYEFWVIRSHVQEGSYWLAKLLDEADESVSAALRANALAFAGFLAGIWGDTASQADYGRRAAALAESAGDKGTPALVWALACLAWAARAIGDHRREFDLARRQIRATRELADRRLLGVTLIVWSPTAMALGSYEEAESMLQEGLALVGEAGDRYRVAMGLNYQGDLARCRQNYASARILYEESVALLRSLDAGRDLASVLHNLGHACLHLGQVQVASSHFIEAMTLQQDLRNRQGMAECLIGFAALALATGDRVQAARLLAAADAQGGQSSAWAATQREYEYCLDLLQGGLDCTRLQAEQESGASLSLDQAATIAVNLARAWTPLTGASRRRDGLTPREIEVVRFIARGLANSEIADALVVSKRTVEKHVANILSKLNFTSRAQIVRWALETAASEDVPENAF